MSDNADKVGLQFSSRSALRDKYPQLDKEYEPLKERSVSRRTVLSPGQESKNSRHTLSASSHEVKEPQFGLGSKIRGVGTQETLYACDQELTYSNDVPASTYALQVALKNMKERYQKLQKKIVVLEEENGRLINGKSELFGEIGKMQESSIKLREKNLQLNHEVHNKHQECCSLKEQFGNLSDENIRLSSQLLQTSNERKKLARQVEDLDKENSFLRKGIQEVLQHCKVIPGMNIEVLSHLEAMASGAKFKSSNYCSTPKTKIVPTSHDFSKNFDAYDNMNDFEDGFSFTESHIYDPTKDFESLSIDAFMKAKENTKKIVMQLQKQKEDLLKLAPLFESISNSDKQIDNNILIGGNQDSPSKKASTNCEVNFISRFATCNSTINPLTLNISEETICRSPPINDSGGETNVLVEEKILSRNQSPFDWRKIEVSDDDTNESSRPQMRTVSTSPDLTLMTFDFSANKSCGRLSSMEEEGRTCPMCNAVFPLLLPQETFESHVVSHFEVENGYEVVS